MIGTNFPKHRFFKNATDLILPNYGHSTRAIDLEKDDDKKKKKQRQQQQTYRAKVPVFKYQNSLKTLKPSKSSLNLPKIDEENHSPKYKEKQVPPTFTLLQNSESTENAKKLIATTFHK